MLQDSRLREVPRPPLAVLLIKPGLTGPSRDIPTVENGASFYPPLTWASDGTLSNSSVVPKPLQSEMSTAARKSDGRKFEADVLTVRLEKMEGAEHGPCPAYRRTGSRSKTQAMPRGRCEAEGVWR